MSNSLLLDIQDEAVDSGSDLASLLRKCKVLAARLDSKPLEDWLLWESNGYPDQATVPTYRIWSVQLKGHFSGSFGSGMRFAPIPLALVPERCRESYERYECRQSIATIESLLRNDPGTLQVDTGNLSLILGPKVYSGMHCLQVWAEMGSGHLHEVLNSVRNRILDFSLALWKQAPAAGLSGSSTGITPAEVAEIFKTTIYDGGLSTAKNDDQLPTNT